MKSTALMVREPGRVVLESQELGAPGPGQVLIEAGYSTLSPGTERHILRGEEFSPPMAIGYSLVGKVIASGAGVSGFAPGDTVAAVAPHASHVMVDARAVIPIPPGTDLEQAAFFNLGHTALYGIRQAQPQLGEAVAVIGQGIVGLIAARLALLAGGLPVIAIDVDEQRLELSRRLGVELVVNGRDSQRVLGLIRSLPGGGVPVVIEVTGSRAPLEQALEIVSVRGRIVLLGTTHGGEAVPFDRQLSFKGASLIGAYVNSKPWSLLQTDMEIRHWPPALAGGSRPYVGSDSVSSVQDIRVILDLIRYGRLDLQPLITHRLAPQEAPAAYERVWAQDRSLVGAVIHWQ